MTPEQLQQAVDKQLDGAEAQGFPRLCSDPAALAVVAAALLEARASERKEVA